MIRVVLLAEDRITRAGVRILIDKESDMSVVGEHELIDDPAAILSPSQPHVTLVDVDRGSRDFVPELITRLSTKTRVIVLTSTHDARDGVERVLVGRQGPGAKERAAHSASESHQESRCR